MKDRIIDYEKEMEYFDYPFWGGVLFYKDKAFNGTIFVARDLSKKHKRQSFQNFKKGFLSGANIMLNLVDANKI